MSIPAPLDALAAAWPFAARQRIRPPPRIPLDLAAIVGSAGWARLPSELRRRFAAGHAPTTYTGALDLDRSVIGAVFAWLARPFGAPLPLRRGRSFASRVRVRCEAGGVVWERCLAAHQTIPELRIRSTKLPGPGRTLIERTEGGLGMVLDVFEEDGALVFLSRSYFLALGRRRLKVPMLLTPGCCRVTHSSEGPDRFRFTLEMIHPVWGRTFYQTGVFNDPEGAAA